MNKTKTYLITMGLFALLIVALSIAAMAYTPPETYQGVMGGGTAIFVLAAMFLPAIIDGLED